ncbi:hypothetical protein V8E54_005935 [Elaphomyces granulatus]
MASSHYLLLTMLGLFPIRYRRDFSVSGTGSAKLEPCRYMPDIVSAELTSYRYDIVKYRADTIIGADICIGCIIILTTLEPCGLANSSVRAVRANTPLTVLVTALDSIRPLAPYGGCWKGFRVSDIAASSTTTAARNVTTARNITTGVAQIQDNGNDLEEEGGDDFRATATVATTATATAATTVTTIATATAAIAARTVAATAAATAATTQPQKRGHPKGSKDKELRKRRQKATGGGDTRATGS